MLTNLLKNINLLKGLDSFQIEALESSAENRTYKKNIIILNKEDITDYMFVLVSGQVHAYVNDDQGRKIIVNTIHAGETFGELAMFSSEPRSASIIAVEDCEVLLIQKDEVFKYLGEAPEFCRNIIQMLAQKVNSLTEDVSSLALLDTYGRIVRVLEQSADESGQGTTTTGKLTQQDIANRVGSSREMVSRILKDLRVGGYINVESKHINILRPLPKGW